MRKYQGFTDDEILEKISVWTDLRRKVAQTSISSRYRWIDNCTKSINELKRELESRDTPHSGTGGLTAQLNARKANTMNEEIQCMYCLEECTEDAVFVQFSNWSDKNLYRCNDCLPEANETSSPSEENGSE